jgi:hypothetical protein
VDDDDLTIVARNSRSDESTPNRPPAPSVRGASSAPTARRTAPHPSPPPPAAPPLPESFWQAAYDLTKVTERIERLADDDRFPQNAEQVAAATAAT